MSQKDIHIISNILLDIFIGSILHYFNVQFGYLDQKEEQRKEGVIAQIHQAE
jgi:hypothetical protein